jgi:hypothetical protein
MNNFNYLENDINDSIFIENEKQLKKYKKKLRQSKNPDKIKEFKDAINEYNFRHAKITNIYKKDPITKSIIKDIDTDNDILDKAISENKGKKIVIVSNKNLKEQRKIKHIQNVNRKIIQSKISGQIKRCMRKYLFVWIKMNINIQKSKNIKVNLFKYTQINLVVKKMIKKWKFYSDHMITRDNMKVLFYEKNQKITIKNNIIKYWYAVVKKAQCNICYEIHKKDNITKTDCGHEFCNDCIKNWKVRCFKKKNDATCPLCRQVFEYRPNDQQRESIPRELWRRDVTSAEQYRTILNYFDSMSDPLVVSQPEEILQ